MDVYFGALSSVKDWEPRFLIVFVDRKILLFGCCEYIFVDYFIKKRKYDV